MSSFTPDSANFPTNPGLPLPYPQPKCSDRGIEVFWKHARVKYRAGVETLALMCLALIGARSHNVT